MIPINLELLGFPISQSDSAEQRDMYPVPFPIHPFDTSSISLITTWRLSSSFLVHFSSLIQVKCIQIIQIENIKSIFFDN